MDDLIISDAEYTAVEKALSTFGKAAEEQITTYLRILTTICGTSIKEGATARNLKAFADHAKGMSGSVEELTNFMKKFLGSFVSSIDDADKYLY